MQIRKEDLGKVTEQFECEQCDESAQIIQQMLKDIEYLMYYSDEHVLKGLNGRYAELTNSLLEKDKHYFVDKNIIHKSNPIKVIPFRNKTCTIK